MDNTQQLPPEPFQDSLVPAQPCSLPAAADAMGNGLFCLCTPDVFTEFPPPFRAHSEFCFLFQTRCLLRFNGNRETRAKQEQRSEKLLRNCRAVLDAKECTT